MDAQFWLDKWVSKQIGFHLDRPNPLLVKHFSKLNQPINSKIFVPLCGKTLDIAWLLSQNFQVVGVELSQLAVDELFAELKITPHISNRGEFKLYQFENLNIWVGDIFQLKPEDIGDIDLIYDRAAMVALPPDLRKNYSEKIRELTGTARQFLVIYEYDQEKMDGPPFSISYSELRSHYENFYKINELEKIHYPKLFRSEIPVDESVFLLELKQ